NADGSNTYYIDLAAVQANTPVYLSFDLIGFGATDSAVTLRDVRLVRGASATGDQASLDEDSSVTLAVLDNDQRFDAALPTLEVVDGPAHGSVVINADGTFTYTPQADYAGEDSFSYRFTEAVSGEVSNVAQVKLTVHPVNDLPTVVTGQQLEVTAGQDLVFDPLAGVTDAEGDALTAVLVGGPAHGTLTVQPDGRFVYRPDAAYAGPDSFSYQVSDGTGLSPVVVVQVAVASANTAPVAADAALTVAEDGQLFIGLAALGSDREGDAFSALVLMQPAHGTLSVLADGRVVYQPNADFHGSDSFTYRLSDGVLDSQVATVVLTVTPVNDAPTVQGQILSLQE